MQRIIVVVIVAVVAIVVVTAALKIAPNNMQNLHVDVAEGDYIYKQLQKALQCKELYLFLESYNTLI